MRIDGSWVLSESGILRPVLAAHIRGQDGNWHSIAFVVDTGADKTVVCYESLAVLGLDVTESPDFRLEGAGGRADSGEIRTDLRLTRETGEHVLFRGPFGALTDPAALDMNLLGRDVLGRFAVVVDRPGDVVTLLVGRHRYIIQEA